MIAQVDQLTIHYGKRVAVDGLSFALEAGQIALRAEVPPRSQLKILYVVVYTWGQ